MASECIPVMSVLTRMDLSCATVLGFSWPAAVLLLCPKRGQSDDSPLSLAWDWC